MRTILMIYCRQWEQIHLTVSTLITTNAEQNKIWYNQEKCLFNRFWMQKNHQDRFKRVISREKFKQNFHKLQERKQINRNKYQTKDLKSFKSQMTEFDFAMAIIIRRDIKNQSDFLQYMQLYINRLDHLSYQYLFKYRYFNQYKKKIQLIAGLKSLRALYLLLRFYLKSKLIYPFFYFQKLKHNKLSLIKYFKFRIFKQIIMNWTEPRKSYKSTQQGFSASKKIQTTCLNTPIFDKEYKSCKFQPQSINLSKSKPRNCPYHFNNQQHVCLTCRKSICLRCAITYCQNHVIKHQKQIIPVLIEDLEKIYIKQKKDQMQTKLGQSQQRQDYFQNKILKLIQKIQENFTLVMETLTQKKLQIINYYDKQFQKYLEEYRNYDQMLQKKLIWLDGVQKQWDLNKNKVYQIDQKFTIQKIDDLIIEIKNDNQVAKAEKKLSNILIGKHKTAIDKLWAEQNLQKVLFEIEKINFKFTKDKQMSIPHVKILQKKKRVATQSSDNHNKPNSSHKSPGIKNMKCSGRVLINKFNSGRKIKEQRLQKSELL